MKMEKAYSTNEDYWTNRETVLDFLMAKLHTESKQGLIGAEYFEGDQVPVPTGELVDVDAIIDIINETAWEIMGEHGEDYPSLTKEEKAELKEVIAAFLDKKDASRFFKVKDVVKKTITAEDLEAAP
jgi:hypothetical protein